MECKNTGIDDLKKVAQCHLNTFPKALSSLLGAEFTSKMLTWYITNERGIIFHLEQEETVMGYLCGVITPAPGIQGSSTSIVQQYFWEFIKAFIKRPWLVFHPELVKRMKFIWRNIKVRFYPQSKDPEFFPKETLENFKPTMGLVIIGISPEFQGKGFGSLLIKEFEKRAITEGISRINLSVKSSNHQAIVAYKHNGWLTDHSNNEELVMYKILDLDNY